MLFKYICISHRALQQNQGKINTKPWLAWILRNKFSNKTMGTIGKLVALFMLAASIVAQTITTAPKVTKVRLEQLEQRSGRYYFLQNLKLCGRQLISLPLPRFNTAATDQFHAMGQSSVSVLIAITADDQKRAVLTRTYRPNALHIQNFGRNLHTVETSRKSPKQQEPSLSPTQKSVKKVSSVIGYPVMDLVQMFHMAASRPQRRLWRSLLAPIVEELTVAADAPRLNLVRLG